MNLFQGRLAAPFFSGRSVRIEQTSTAKVHDQKLLLGTVSTKNNLSLTFPSVKNARAHWCAVAVPPLAFRPEQSPTFMHAV